MKNYVKLTIRATLLIGISAIMLLLGKTTQGHWQTTYFIFGLILALIGLGTCCEVAETND